MSTDASPEDVAAATAYDTLLVPALFEAWAPRVADAARLSSGARVLDVACGTGVLTREVAARVGDASRVAGLDLSPGMLAVAQRAAPSIGWQQGAAQSLPFADESFDAVVSQFALMFFPDRAGALREMLRVSAAGGRLAVAVWGSLDDNPAYAHEVALLERLAGRDAADAVRAPFSLGDREALESLAAEAGLGSATVRAHAGKGRFPSVRAMVEADLRGWLPMMGITLDEALIDVILCEAEDALAQFVTTNGRLEFATSALILTAAKP